MFVWTSFITCICKVSPRTFGMLGIILIWVIKFAQIVHTWQATMSVLQVAYRMPCNFEHIIKMEIPCSVCLSLFIEHWNCRVALKLISSALAYFIILMCKYARHALKCTANLQACCLNVILVHGSRTTATILMSAQLEYHAYAYKYQLSHIWLKCSILLSHTLTHTHTDTHTHRHTHIQTCISTNVTCKIETFR